jgi:limonene-1,2-epoxide hydrolase
MGAGMFDVTEFKSVYQQLGTETLALLDRVYAPDCVFIDPFHEIHGRDALHAYFARLYDGVADIHFVWHDTVTGANQAMINWTMQLRHKRFRPDDAVAVQGATHLRFDDRVTYHRDYFDAGALIYERVPLLGAIVRGIKKQL